jgi:hypothetical protein
MQPILFNLRKRFGGTTLGVGPTLLGTLPLPAAYFRIGGITKDSTGAALGGCTVKLFRTADDVEVDQTLSDGGGNYEFRSSAPAKFYYAVAYKPGAPDVAGTTVNTLAGA